MSVFTLKSIGIYENKALSVPINTGNATMSKMVLKNTILQ